MAGFFFDSCALAKRYLDEPGTPRVLDIIERSRRVRVSRLSLVEVASAAVRHAREGLIASKTLEGILLALEEDFRGVFEVNSMEARIIERAVTVVRTHALRAADAIQLATALHAAQQPGTIDDLVFVSADHELNDAARKEGLTVLDPSGTG